MVDIFLSLVTWLVPSEKVKEGVKDMMAQHKVNTKKLKDNIRDLNLGIANEDSLNNEVSVRKRSTVFFPVVPRRNLSIIHLVFANAIRGLSALGLNVKIFVFDDYYRRVKSCTESVGKEDIKNFISEFTNRGVKRNNIVLESDLLSKPADAQKLLFRIRELGSKKTIKEIKELREKTSAFTKEDDAYIRQEKILYNLAYISMFENIGFVLCGADEVPMWDAFINLENNTQGGKTELSQLVILSIPKMKNSNGDDTGIWDEGNLCTDKDIQTIKDKIRENLPKTLRRKDCGVFYLLANLFFAQGKEYKFVVEESDGSGENTILIKTIDKLISKIGAQYNEDTKEISERIVDDLANCIYEIMHEQKKEEKQNG